MTQQIQAILIGVVLAGFTCAQQELITDLVPLPLLNPVQAETPVAAVITNSAVDDFHQRPPVGAHTDRPNTNDQPQSQVTFDQPAVALNLEELGFPQVPAEFDYEAANSGAADIALGNTEAGNTEAGNAEESLQLIKPWWHEQLSNPDVPAFQAELEELIWLAISHSPHVQSVLLEPQILDTRAAAKLGVFDPNRFVDSIFKDTSDPVGNTLVTGGPPRLNDNLWENRAGVRARNQYGGQTEFFQEMLFKDSNSRFFTPGNQSDSRMVLQYTQPLRRGRGSAYNRSSFVIATFAANQSRHQTASALQDHAYQITEAYWSLFASRVTQSQIARGITNLEQLRNRLIGRAEIDSLRSQILRSEAVIAKQQAALANARAQVRSSEASIRALIASPELRGSNQQIIPITTVNTTAPQMDASSERIAALEHQPRVLEVQEEIKAARTKLHVAQNELQPTLNLVLQGYLRGLSGDFDVGNSLEDQFSSTPSYHAGIAYQRPKGNLAAQAIARESRMELRRALLKLDDTLLSVGANVEIALAGVEAAYQQLDSAVRSTLATQAEIQYLDAQWNDAFMSGDSPSSLQLDQLLNAHIQLIASEANWVGSERDYMLALARLSLATGTLLPTFGCP